MKNLYQTWVTGGSGYAVLQDKLIVYNRMFNSGSVTEEPSTLEWIDLGLPSGTLWASCNVGATKPEDSGLYFAWGETEGYTGITDTKKFIWDDYKWGNDTRNLTKYTDPKYGYISPEDDAAYQRDNTCRMPTEDEWYELATHTIITQQTLNGVNGLSFASKVNDNSIFVAATGIYKDGEFKDYGQSCFLWTTNYSSLGSAGFAAISIDGTDLPFKGVFSLDRCSGYNIRAVKSVYMYT